MHIAFLIPDLAGGGAQHMVINMANEFASRGHKVDLLVVKDEGPYKEKVEKAVNVICFHRKKVFYAMPPLRKYLQNNKPDILMAAITNTNLLAAITKLFTHRLKTKIILTERNFFSMRIKKGNGAVTAFVMTVLVRLFYRFADRVVGISKGVADDIQTVANLPDNKIVWIHNPVVTEQTLKALEEDREDSWFNEIDVPVIVTSGRLVEQKDYPTMLQAFARLLMTREAKLLVLGQGVLKEDLERMCETLGIAEHVYFKGFVDNPYPFMKKADVFVMSSQWEGFCNVIVEALLCGLSVVATDCPSGPAEILDNGKYGTLVPVGDVEALAQALDNALQKNTDTEQPKNRAMCFTAEKICDQYEQLFEDIVGGSQ